MKIRWKLFLALVLLVSGVAVAALWLAERQFVAWVSTQVLASFERDVNGLLEARRERLSEVREIAMKLAHHEVVLEARDGEAVEVSLEDRQRMSDAYVELFRGRDRVKASPPISRRSAALPLMGVVSPDGNVCFISKRRGRVGGSWRKEGGNMDRLADERGQVVGFALLDERSPGVSRVKEIVVTPILENGEWAGWFFLGRDAESREEKVLAKYGNENSWTGLWVDGEWFVDGVDEGLAAEVEVIVEPGFIQQGKPKRFEWNGEDYLLLARELNPESPLGRGAQVAVFALNNLEQAVGKLRWGVAGLGGLALLVSIIAAWLLSFRFSGPIHRLVEGTEKVREGDYSWKVEVGGKDEFSVLANEFNRMTKDLGLKERYRDVLSKTSDSGIVERLIDGSMELGGEIREAAVLFCDIRGFTEMTDGMEPTEVIEMLNRHMTAMTQLIHQHGGVVDKFVGDLVMGVFGAPVSREDDTIRAAKCAVAMIQERTAMNAAGGDHVEVGIGLASGELVSGLMGSEDRLNYTVLGDRVNLASRLCSLAASGEVLVDGATADKLDGRIRSQSRGSMEVRGFSKHVDVCSLEIGRD